MLNVAQRWSKDIDSFDSFMCIRFFANSTTSTTISKAQLVDKGEAKDAKQQAPKVAKIPNNRVRKFLGNTQINIKIV